MTWEEYKVAAARTANHKLDDETAYRYCLLKLFGEVGEVVDAYGKYRGQGHSEEWLKDTLTEELGDVEWYLALYENLVKMGVSGPTALWEGEKIDFVINSMMFYAGDLPTNTLMTVKQLYKSVGAICQLFGISRSEMRKKNIEKLQARYPDGFDAERSQWRDEVEKQLG